MQRLKIKEVIIDDLIVFDQDEQGDYVCFGEVEPLLAELASLRAQRGTLVEAVHVAIQHLDDASIINRLMAALALAKEEKA